MNLLSHMHSFHSKQSQEAKQERIERMRRARSMPKLDLDEVSVFLLRLKLKEFQSVSVCLFVPSVTFCLENSILLSKVCPRSL